jgi:DNA-binding IclR family transcriptional regulator
MSRAPGRPGRPGKPGRAAPPIQSVARAVQLLKALAAMGRPASVPMLAGRCGLQRTTAWRLLITMEDAGLVEREPGTGLFRVGYGALAIAGSLLGESHDMVRLLRPVLEGLAARTGETAALTILRGESTVVVDQVAPSAVLTANWVGKDFPPHTSSPGKLLLAAMPTVELDRLLGRPLARLTPRTITDPAVLRRELARVRATGLAVSDEEFELGCVGISAAVYGWDPFPVATLSVIGPSLRVPQRRLKELGQVLVSAADDAARRLGYRETPVT